jgi:hypothetical protein
MKKTQGREYEEKRNIIKRIRRGKEGWRREGERVIGKNTRSSERTKECGEHDEIEHAKKNTNI